MNYTFCIKQLYSLYKLIISFVYINYTLYINKLYVSYKTILRFV